MSGDLSDAARLRKEGRAEEARAILLELAAERPDDPPVQYRKAMETLREGAARFPGNRAMEVFLAMALYNVGEHRQATGLLLRTLAETSADREISAYKEAILFYAGRLDEVPGAENG